MILKNLLFTGMDIPKEVEKMLGKVYLHNMTEEEKQIYRLGEANAIRALRALLRGDEHLVVFADGFEMPEEIDLNELINLWQDKEEFKYGY